jgi:hypothetical protein
MVSDTDLARGRIAPAEGQDVPLPKAPPVLRKRLWFLILLLANVVSWCCVYGLWTGRPLPVLKVLAIDRARVTGIIYNQENPCAIVRDRVVHEGDTINGYKVVKIHEDRVEFEKDGEVITRQLR